MSWEKVLKDKTALKRRNIQHANSLFNQKGRQYADKFGGQSNAKYDAMARMVKELEFPRTFNDDEKFFKLFDRITFLLA
jgi:hypothetical protein